MIQEYFLELAMCWDSAAIKRPKPSSDTLGARHKGTLRTQVAGSTGTAKLWHRGDRRVENRVPWGPWHTLYLWCRPQIGPQDVSGWGRAGLPLKSCPQGFQEMERPQHRVSCAHLPCYCWGSKSELPGWVTSSFPLLSLGSLRLELGPKGNTVHMLKVNYPKDNLG